MKKQTKIQEQKKSEKRSAYDIAMLIIAIITLALTAYIGVSANKITIGQNKLNNLYLPIVFSVDKGDSTYEYGNTGIPGYVSELSIVSGALKDVAVIRYNGDLSDVDVAGTEQLNISESGDFNYSFTTQVPNNEVDISQVYYDYFFLYTVSSSDVVALDCYYYEIDFQNKTNLGPYKLPRAELLTVQDKVADGTSSSTREDMLIRYYEMIHMVNDILVAN